MVMASIPEEAEVFIDDSLSFASHLQRWVVNPATQSMSSETLDDTSGELPRIDSRYVGHDYR